MNPRVSRSSALASQGHRLPDRQGRGAAGRRLHARRARERHHRRRDAGELRADHRLCRHQDPALRVREIPRRRQPPHHLDEVGRRGHGHRPHLPGIAAEGAALARNRPHRPQRNRHPRPRPQRGREQERHPRRRRRRDARPAAACRRSHAARHERRGHLRRLQDRHVVPRADPAASSTPKRRSASSACRDDAAQSAQPQVHGLFRHAASPTSPASRPRTCARCARASTCIPVYKRIDTSAAEFASPTAYMYSTYEMPFAGAVADEARPSDRKKVVILGGGPNRIGQGIEFDYCCCHASLRAARCRLRNHHGQLQPRDRLDRLRHLGPPLFRAADRRGRDRDPRAREVERHAARRHRPVRRPDPAQPRRRGGEGRRADPRHPARLHRPRRRPRPVLKAHQPARADASPRTASPIRWSRPASSPSASAIRWSSARPTCWAAAPCRSSARPTSSRPTCRTR